jgi:hypothetical protein
MVTKTTAGIAGRLPAIMCVLLIAAGTAGADTVRVVTDRALIWNSPSGVAVILTQVSKDAVLEVVRRVDDWYEVVLPPASSGSSQSVGYVLASQVTIASSGPRSDRAEAAARRAAPPPRPARTGAAATRTAFFNLSGTFQQGGTGLTLRSPAFADHYVEPGSITGVYGRGDAWKIDVLGGQTVARRVGIGLGISYQRRDRSAPIAAEVPHPFFFNQLRPATFDTSPLRRRELAVHIPVVWMPSMPGRTRALLFGGPSIFHITQDVVSNLSLAETYPYDQVTVTDSTQTELSSTVVGFHVGGDLAYMFTPGVGVGGGVRYSSGQTEFRNDADATGRRAGGLEVMAGIRFRF